MAMERALTEQPEAFSKPMLKAMAARTSKGIYSGDQPPEVPNPFAYLQNGARLTSFQANLNWAYLMTGITSALLRGANDEALTRALLGIAIAEQVAIDSGRWTFAWELAMLPEKPPYHLFPQRATGSDDTLTHSALIDERWWDVVSNRIKDTDDMVERKRKLESRPRPLWAGSGAQQWQPQQQQHPGAVADGAATGAPKGDKGPKGRGKNWWNKGNQAAAADAAVEKH